METNQPMQIIREDLKRITGLLRQAEAVSLRTQEEMQPMVLEELFTELASHSRVKQEAFYPAVAGVAQAADDSTLFGFIDEAFDDVQDLDLWARELRSMDIGTPMFRTRFEEFSHRLETRVTESDPEILRRVEGCIGGFPTDLEDRMIAIRDRMMEGVSTIQGPHGGEQMRKDVA